MDNQLKQKEGILLSTIYNDSCAIIEDARERAYRAVNVALTIRNWKLGERIARDHIGSDGRAEYGKHIITSLANMLTRKYGKGFDTSSLHTYVKFFNMFPGIVDALRPQFQQTGNQANTILDACVQNLKMLTQRFDNCSLGLFTVNLSEWRT